MKSSSRWAWVLVCAMVPSLACDDDSDGSTSGNPSDGSLDSAGSVAAFLSARRSFYRESCAFEARCASERGSLHGSRADCEALVDFYAVSDLRSFRAAADDPDAPAQFSPAEVPACLSELRSRDCEVTEQFTNCVAAFGREAVNELTEGEVCAGDAVAKPGLCEVGLTCPSGDVGDCRQCVEIVMVGEGEACGTEARCEAPFGCDGGFCRIVPPPARRGESCSEARCLGALRCIGPDESRSCQDYLEEGRTCRGTYDPPCYQELECSEYGVCERRLPDGELCERDSSPGCLNFCVFENPLDEFGTCQPLNDLPKAGEPCAYRLGSVCDHDTVVDESGEGCVCAALLLPGARCSGNYECESDVCSGGVCEDQPRANGEECPSRNDLQCASGNCDTSLDPPTCTAACEERFATGQLGIPDAGMIEPEQ